MRGFTIIESMLFLAISGALIVAMIAGTGASINIQRYRDAVETFKSLLQEQYAELNSVRNERDDSWSCNSQAQTTQDTGEVRGQSQNCFLVGRYLAITGGDITIHTVVGVETGPSAIGNDIDRLRDNYRLDVSTVSQETRTMEWGTQIAWPRSIGGVVRGTPTTPRDLALLFVRSPDSGQIYTFSSDNAPVQPTPQVLRDMIVPGLAIPGQSERTICIDSSGLFVTSDLSVYMARYATGPSSIETRSNDFIESLDPTAQGSRTEC